MKTLGQLIVVGFLCANLSSGTAVGQQHEPWKHHADAEAAHFVFDRYSVEDAATMMSLWERLAPQPVEGDWTGEFWRRYSELGSSFLRISKNGYVRATVHSCMPHVVTFDYGAVEVDEHRITLLPATPLGRDTTMLKVRWGDMRYLVDESEIADFCRRAAGLVTADEQYVDGSFRKCLTGSCIVTGTPVVPPGYEKYVRQPIAPRIVSFGPGGGPATSRKIRVRFDRGSTSGVKKGMTFYHADSDWFVSVEVERVGKNWCIASTYEYDKAGFDTVIGDTSAFGVGSEWTTCLDYIPCPYK
jgi:hypothetical protein